MTRLRSTRPQLTTDFQRRIWPVVDVWARLEHARAVRAEIAGTKGSGSAA